MTNPTITYGHAPYITDCDGDPADWIENPVGMNAAQCQLLSQYGGDVFTIEGTCDDAGDENVTYDYDIPAAQHFSTDLYPIYLIRWRTSHSSNALGARVHVIFTAGNQTLLPTSGPIPQFNVNWNVTIGTLTAGKTVDRLYLIADDYPDAVDSGTYYVDFDFVLFCKGIFTFPHVSPGGVKLDVPRKDVEIDIPSRDGGIHQNLGMKSPFITVTGDMEHRTDWGWGTINYPYGERLLKIVRDTDPFQWFTSDIINCKVTSPQLMPLFQSSNEMAQRLYELRLKQYSLSSLGESTWDDRHWYGF